MILLLRTKNRLLFSNEKIFVDLSDENVLLILFQTRDRVSQIADECGTESRDAVIHSLKEHFLKHGAHGTVSSDIDAWTRRRRKFVGNGLSWVERPSWKLKRAIASCASLPVGISVRAPMLRDTIDNGYLRLQIPIGRVFA